MRKVLAAAMLMAGALAFHPATAQERPIPGAIWTVWGYCMTEDAARAMSAEIARFGDSGAVNILKSDVPCYHKQFHSGIPEGNVRLVERSWTVLTPENETVEFWKFADRNGENGWVWYVVPENSI